MTVTVTNNPYNQLKSEYGQNYDILHIALWSGETLPKNYAWYGLGQIAERTEYPELYAIAEKYGFVVSEDEWQSGLYGKFSSGDGETTFRFPLIRDGDVLSFTNGSTTPNGKNVEPELPNITGKNSSVCVGSNNIPNITGAFVKNSNFLVWSGGLGTSLQMMSVDMGFDASHSNSTYKNGGSVKHSGIASRLIIKYR